MTLAGKASSRLRVKLPFSPRKRKAITLKLAIEEGSISMTTSSGKDGETDEQKKIHEQVVEFYNRDDISWAAPGMRASVEWPKSEEKILTQMRYMTMNIIKAHQIFKSEHPDVKFGKVNSLISVLSTLNRYSLIFLTMFASENCMKTCIFSGR
jgi:hypothetical protein